MNKAARIYMAVMAIGVSFLLMVAFSVIYLSVVNNWSTIVEAVKTDWMFFVLWAAMSFCAYKLAVKGIDLS